MGERATPSVPAVKVGQITTATTTAAQTAPGAGRRIRVWGLRMSAAGVNAITINDGTSNYETFNLVAGSFINLPVGEHPLYVLPENTPLNLVSNSTGAVDARVHLDIA